MMDARDHSRSSSQRRTRSPSWRPWQQRLASPTLPSKVLLIDRYRLICTSTFFLDNEEAKRLFQRLGFDIQIESEITLMDTARILTAAMESFNDNIVFHECDLGSVIDQLGHLSDPQSQLYFYEPQPDLDYVDHQETVPCDADNYIPFEIIPDPEADCDIRYDDEDVESDPEPTDHISCKPCRVDVETITKTKSRRSRMKLQDLQVLDEEFLDSTIGNMDVINTEDGGSVIFGFEDRNSAETESLDKKRRKRRQKVKCKYCSKMFYSFNISRHVEFCHPEAEDAVAADEATRLEDCNDTNSEYSDDVVDFITADEDQVVSTLDQLQHSDQQTKIKPIVLVRKRA